MIYLRWAPFPGADVVSYNVYRSLIGFVAPIPAPSALAGLTLQLALNSFPTQTVTFDGVTDVVTSINNQIIGGQAYASILNPAQFIFRDNVREAPGSVQVVGGTALTVLGLSPGTITQLSSVVLLSTVPGLVGAAPGTLVDFTDSDGALQDYYAVTTIDHLGNESLKTPFRQPITSTGNLCVIEGVVSNLQGVRLVDCEVKAHLMIFPKSLAPGVFVDSREPICTLTGDDGRFSLPLLQGTLVRLEIPAVGYSRDITVPCLAFAFITDLPVDLHYKFNPDPQFGLL